MNENLAVNENPEKKARKSPPLKHILFYTRLFLYLFVFAIPIVHPAVVVPYDRMGWWLWFGLLPGEMLIAFYLRPPRLSIRAWAVVAALPILATIVLISGVSRYSLAYFGVGAAAFLVTTAIFHGGRWGRWLALPEPFLLAILYYKMLSFSRASEQIAARSQGITQALLVIAIAAFLLHSLVLYFSTYRPKSSGRGKRELFVFLSVVIPVVLAVAVFLPPNFVSHQIVLNSLDKKVKPKPVPLDLALNGLPGGNLRSPRYSRDQGNQGKSLSDIFGGSGFGNQQGNDQNGSNNTLEGIPSDQWNNGTQSGQGPGRQYAVMVVKSAIDPVYAADAYYGKLDPVQGFEKTQNQPLNDLTHRHLLETWKQASLPQDLGRRKDSIFFLSTLPARVLSYLPYSVEPTILNRQYYPFSYSYDSVSLVNVTNPREWLSLPGLDEQQKQEFSQYLQVPLAPKDKQVFQSYLERVFSSTKPGSSQDGNEPGYFARLIDILRSFSSYQYKIGFTDNVTVAHLENFLTSTKTGDCTEFSNTTAVLARLAGIPARVVTGYLASKDLQTPAHLRGLSVLRSQIKPLQQYPMNELYLVTTADRHSWVQVWLPRYGWVDIETTSFAIPPAAGGDPNNWNVVIPLINGQKELSPVYQFPWGLALRFLVFAAALTLLVIYLYRYGREIYLLNLSRGRGKRALEALYKLLLLRLAVNDYDLKAPSQTPNEYAADHPELDRFAELYTELRYRESFPPGQQEQLWKEIKQEYRSLVRSCRKRGFLGGLRRAFGLKGLYYRW